MHSYVFVLTLDIILYIILEIAIINIVCSSSGSSLSTSTQGPQASATSSGKDLIQSKIGS